MTVSDLQKALARHASKKRAQNLSRFFKTGPGQYAEGDVFMGLTVPQIRTVAREFRNLSLDGIEQKLSSPLHETRLCALLILVDQYDRGDLAQRKAVYRFYLRHLRYVNNWDLVDLSADRIAGRYMLETGDSGGRLLRLAKSKNLWERRVAVLSTFAFIKAGRATPTLNVARILLRDPHDLIQKAVGWMLREVGKRIDQEAEEVFLKAHYHRMPRTMLRYAIERFPARLRRAYLSGSI